MKCFKFENRNESCTQWQYNTTIFDKSVISEFDLVCDRSNYASWSQSFYMLGYVVSGLVFSHYSDKYGRRPIVWLSFTIEIIGIFFCAFAVNIYMYSIARFMVGMGGSGRGMAVYTILMESCGPKYRSDIAILGGIGWVLGYAAIPGLAYLLRDFRYMQFFSAIPMLIMMFWFYFFYESPRWQITNGKVEQAEITLRNAVKMNGKSDVNLKAQLTELSDYLQRSQSEGGATKSHSLLDLIRTPMLRRITLIMWYNWVVNALIYYGLSFNMGDFGGNIFITFLLSGLVELPSQLLSALFLRFIGRRKLFAIFMLTTSISCFAVIPSRSNWLKVTFALIGKFGVSSSWNVMAIQGPELYPTILRHTGLGASSVVARIGSISAPFMKNLAANEGLAIVMVLYGTITAIGAVLGMFFPETKGREIPDTIAEAENCGSIKLKVINSKDNEMKKY